ncbi:TfoX/Sxy family DNA transformation protein [Vibrio zhugei]|uniref:TfoX/Sxy family DNA transformation protein n=1 Tax=Vibrio zhugei TaxID=2479546 RepID=A0ABV7CEJ7_9VIBR|nr:TfoX/Sxy family DNA transformation protein [Vibrio zhugei]
MSKEVFNKVVEQYGAQTTRSMFGGIGFFHCDVMYALYSRSHIYLRGTQPFESQLQALGCQKFKHVKKTTVATVNYYDISAFLLDNIDLAKALIDGTMQAVIEEEDNRRSVYNQRLRDLLNLQLTTERMLKKVGISDVSTFFHVGAVAAFVRITEFYGHKTDIRLLWKLAAAQEGIYWELLEETRKQALLNEYEQRVYV